MTTKKNFNTILERDIVKNEVYYNVEVLHKNGKLLKLFSFSNSFTIDEIYKILKKTGELRTDVLAKKIDRERSTVYRSLQKLTSCSLCTKTTKTIETGGYYHTYSCNDTELVKEKIISPSDFA